MLSLRNGGRGLIAPALSFFLPFTFVDWMPDPNVAKWGVVYLMALLSAVSLWRKELILDRVDLALGALVAWCGISLLWSPDSAAGIDSLGKWAAVAVLFVCFRRLDLPKWTIPAAVAGAVVAWACGFEYGGLGNPGFAAEFLLIAAPMLDLASAAVVVGGAFLLASALPAVGAAAYVLWWVRRWPLCLATMVSALAVVSVVGFAQSVEVFTSVETRLDLWVGTLAAWWRHPFTGWGLGSFLHVFPSFAGTGESFGFIPYSVEAARYANAAHNEFVQLLMEAGLVGFGLAVWLIWEVWRGGRSDRAKYALVAGFVFACLGFPMQNPATAVLIAFVAARLAASPLRGWRAPSRPVAVAGAVTASILLASVPNDVLAEANLSAARRYQEVMETYPEAPLYALDHLNRAYALSPGNFQARIGLFVMAVLAEERGLLPREEVENAYHVAQSASPYDPRVLLARLRTYVRRKECKGQCDFIAQELVRTAGRKQEVRWLSNR